MVYEFDGTYEGLLTTVFYAFKMKQFDVSIVSACNKQNSLFSGNILITADQNKATRILIGLNKVLNNNAVNDFWRAFLSEDEKIYNIIFRLLIKVFQNKHDILQNFGDSDVLYFHQTVKKVNREKHRMKAFIRFQKSSDGLYSTVIDPDFNVLPLIVNFFRNRYADQPWLIFDNKRKYGLYYDLNTVTEVTNLSEEHNAIQEQSTTIELDLHDIRYENMWRTYFNSTNIEARKNLKLHLRHVPRRYWKYLPEKQARKI